MKKKHFGLILIMLLINPIIKAQHAYIKIDFNNCYNCHKILNNAILECHEWPTSLLFNIKATPEQIDEFIQTNFNQKKISYLKNKDLYNTSRSISLANKNPTFIIAINDSIIFECSTDSIGFYKKDINNFFLQKTVWNKRVIANKRLKRNYSSNHINAIDNNLFIINAGNPNQVFVYDTNTDLLDSINLWNNISVVNNHLSSRNINVDLIKTDQFYKQNKLPYSTMGVGYETDINNKDLYTQFWIEYFPKLEITDIMKPNLDLSILEYNSMTKKTTLYPVYDQSFDKSDTYNGLMLHYAYINKINDTLFMLGTENLNDTIKAFRQFIFLSYDKINKDFRFNGKLFSIKTDSLYTFDDEKMNKPYFFYGYKLLTNFLVYNQSPYFYNFSSHKTFTIKYFDNKATYIHDAEENEYLLKILVEEDDRLVLLNIEKNSMRLVSSERIEKFDNEGNIALQGNKIIGMDSSGNIIVYTQKE
jgi:hypothetical protein